MKNKITKITVFMFPLVFYFVILTILSLQGNPRSEVEGLAQRVQRETVATNAVFLKELTYIMDAGWVAVPENSSIFFPGHLFSQKGGVHVIAVSNCVDAPIKEDDYLQTEVTTTLQAGVLVGWRQSNQNVGAELFQKIQFLSPKQYSIDGFDMYPSDACVEKLKEQKALGRDLSDLYLIKEVISAQVATITCGNIDSNGRFSVLGRDDQTLALACSQASLEPVGVFYRIEPLPHMLDQANTSVAIHSNEDSALTEAVEKPITSAAKEGAGLEVRESHADIQYPPHTPSSPYIWIFTGVSPLGHSKKYCRVFLRRNEDKFQYDQINQEATGIGKNPVIKCSKLASLLRPKEICNTLVKIIRKNKSLLDSRSIRAKTNSPFNDFTSLYYNVGDADPVRFKSDKRTASAALNELINVCGSE
jgi:hypothetical protein